MMMSMSRMATPLRRIPQSVRAVSANAMTTGQQEVQRFSRCMPPAVSVDISSRNGPSGGLGTSQQILERALERVWAKTYDADLAGAEDNSPIEVAKHVSAGLKFVRKNGPLTILDAGCGTGLVGEELRRLHGQGGHFNVVGADISPGMLVLAKNRGYSETHIVDMNKPLEYPTHSFDAVACSGVLIEGHVGASPAIPEFCRVVRPGGQIVASVRKSLCDDAFKAMLEELEKQGHELNVPDISSMTGVQSFLLKIRTAAASE